MGRIIRNIITEGLVHRHPFNIMAHIIQVGMSFYTWYVKGHSMYVQMYRSTELCPLVNGNDHFA